MGNEEASKGIGERFTQAVKKILAPKPTRYEKALGKIVGENTARTEAGNRMSGKEFGERLAAIDKLYTKKDWRRHTTRHAD